MSAPTREERLNNPGGLVKTAIQWLGLRLNQSADPTLCDFEAPLYGIRAIAMDLLHGFRVEGRDTVRKFITAWAPPIENDTEAYIADEAQFLGVEPDEVVRFGDPAVMAEAVTGIIHHENGRCIYSAELIQQAVAMAYVASKRLAPPST